MKYNHSSPSVNDTSAVIATLRQVVRSPAFVGLFLAVLIILLAWLRLTGPPWQALWMPFDLRESEGNTLTWEQIHYFNALRATLQSSAESAIGNYGTDHYRGILPIYVSSIVSWWLDSSYKGYALVDLLGWWLAAWTLYYLARRLDADRSSALVAAVMLSTSPLLIGHMWNNGLHTMQSASYVPYFLAAFLFLTDKNLAFGLRVIGVSGTLYVASLTYQYQWLIAPLLLSLAVVDRRRWVQISAIVASIILFIVVTLLTYQILGITGIPVHSSANDPIQAIIYKLHLKGDTIWLMQSLLSVLELSVRSYHPFIVSISVLGMIFSCARLRILLCVGTVLVLASSYFHPIFYVTMNGYPFMYISAGLALVQGPRRLADLIARIGSVWFPQCGERITSVSRMLAYMSTVILILLAVWSTNTDLFGDYRFAQQWLGDSRW